MNYPSINEYKEAILFAEDNFEQLKNLRPVLDEEGNPVMSSGNFAVVFKMKDEQTGKLHAVKCFLKEQEGRAEAYRMIAEELEYVSSTFLTPIKYLEKELFVDTNTSDETEFPVLLMDWVEGVTLDKYIRENLYDEYALSLLAYQFSRLAMWLMPQPFAHGDLKPDNILVRDDGTLVLVDYDGMYVPAMKGQKARELGSPDFRHPNRNETDFDEHIDDFSLISILLSLKAISLNPELLEQYGASDRLLFSEKDYREVCQCELLKSLYPSSDSELNVLVSLFTLALEKRNLSEVSFGIISVNRPKEPNYDNLSTVLTVEDWEDRCEDGNGASYSKDGKKLLGFGSYCNTGIYKIKEGTLAICDLAFNNFENDNHYLKGIYIPSSVIAIGDNPFAGCIDFAIHCESPLFKIENGLLYDCLYERLIANTNSTEAHIEVHSNVRVIGAYSLCYCRAKNISIPNHVVTVEEFAFACSEIECLIIPLSISRIERLTFLSCHNLTDIVILGGDTVIENTAFDNCSNLRHIFVLTSRINYYHNLFPNIANKFVGIGNYDDIYVGQDCFADELFNMGEEYWNGNNVDKDFNEAIKLYNLAGQLGHKKALKEYNDWGNYWFDKNIALYSKDRKTILGLWSCYISDYQILEGTEKIADNAFFDLGSEIDYSYLDKIVIPPSIRQIGHSPFNKYLSEIVCHSPCFEVDNNTLFTRGKKRLIQCFSKAEEFIVPDEVEYIDNHAFYGCESKRIIISASVIKIGINPFAEMDMGGGLLEVISLSSKFTVDNHSLYEDNTKLLSYWGKDNSFTVPNGIEVIGEYAFFASELKTINLPESIESIGDCAFGWCFSLTQVLAPANAAEKFQKIMDRYQDMIRIVKE